MTYIIAWLIFGIIGAVGIGLGTNTDGEGLDTWDYFFLSCLALLGICTFFLGIAFWSMYIGSKLK